MTEKSLKSNSLYNVIYNAANLLFPLMTYIHVARVLLPAGTGRVAYGQNIASYFVSLAALGLPSYGIREIAKVRNDRERTNKLFTELIVLNSFFTCIAVASYLVLIFRVKRFRSDYLLFLSCGIPILMNLFNVDWLYRGLEEYRYITIRSIIVKLICLLAVFAFVRDREDYISYAIISSLAVTLNNLFNIVHAGKRVSLNFHGLHFLRHLEPLLILALSIFLSSAYSKIDVTMLGTMSTDTSIGLYNNAHKAVDIIIQSCAAITAVFLPRLSFYYEQDTQKFNSLLEKGIKLLSFFSFPLAIGLFVLAPQMLRVAFGVSYIPGSSTVRIFAVLIIVKSFGDLLCYQLALATRNEKKRLPAYLSAAILNITFNAILIPKMAQNGAAVASVISELTVNVVQFLSLRKIVNIPVLRKPLLQGFATSVVMGIIVFLVGRISSNSYIQILSGFLTGAGVYLLLNILVQNEVVNMAIDILRKRKNKV